MSCQTTKTPEGFLVQLESPVRPDLSLELSETLHRLMEQKQARVVLDLKGVAFIDSSALGLIIFASKRLQQNNGQLCIKNPSPAIAELLEDSGTDKIITILKED